MAINVNTVYQTVLLILNKEQRGYMTPVEFNRTGTQAQLEIFENYFEDLNQQIRIPQTDTDYASRTVGIDEKMSYFKEFGSATYNNPVFELPGITNYTSGLPSATQTFSNNPVTNPATLTGSALTLSNSAGISEVFLNGVELSPDAYTLNGATLTLVTTPVLNDSVVINLYANQFYRLGNLFYTAGALSTQELERVTRSELFHLNSSNLTKPTTTYPIYTYEANNITVYPVSIVSGIDASYIRKPIPPVWNFTVTNNAYVYSPQISFNFEIHPSEQTELILKILLYAGVVIKSPEIIQVAASQIQQEQTNQKS